MSETKPTLNGMPLEIERKYLIVPPSDEVMKKISECTGYDRSAIEQIYIKGEGGSHSRIRKREYASGVKYYHTTKQNINGLTRIEIENEITAAEYDSLKKTVLDGTRAINKVRYCFDYEGQTFELDIYDFDREFATLEIELESESQKVTLPNFIEVIEEVTGQPQYTNFALSAADNDG